MVAAGPGEATGALVRSAWETGEAAAEAGDFKEARRWFDRAHRLAPQQDRITLSLALALLREGDAAAIELLRAVAGRHDLRPVWLALAAAESRAGHAPSAAEALERALSGHVWNRAEVTHAPMLDTVAAQADRPGWCALATDGTLLVGWRAGWDLKAALDGRPIRLRERKGRPCLAPGWEVARALSVEIAGRELLGSPIRISTLRRIEGFVESRDGELTGWAWHPAEPEADPALTIGPANSARPIFRIVARDRRVSLPEAAPLAQQRSFRVSATRLRQLSGPISVRGRDGQELAGSPLDPGFESRAAAAAARSVAELSLHPGAGAAKGGRQRQTSLSASAVGTVAVAPRLARSHPARAAPAPLVDVVVPVHGGVAATLACLDSVLRYLPRFARLIVVDDASPEPTLVRAIDALVANGRLLLLRHARSRGFPAASNAGIRAARPRSDVILLNSDTLVAEGWIEGLRAALRSDATIGTVTPLSNDATILSYPERKGGNPVPDEAATAELARLAAKLHYGKAIEIPTGVGFCLYLRRACLAEVGLFREDLFAQGYGEENDFCMRARHLGWRHIAAPGVFVAHVGGQSFGALRSALATRNLAVLNRLYPGYDALIAAYRATDPLLPFRRRLDAARFAIGRSRRGAVILVTHARGGGVARVVKRRAAVHRKAGLRPIVLRPASQDGESNGTMVGGEDGDEFPNLCYAVPDELDELASLLRPERPKYAELHHLVGHAHEILELCSRLGVHYDAYVHDYAPFCGRIALVGAAGRYCGEPEPAICTACIADAGSEIEEEIAPADLVQRSAAELAAARRVVAPSADAAARYRRHFPDLTIAVTPWEDDTALPAPQIRRFAARRCICVIGAIGIAKGYDVLLAAGRDAAWRDLPLRFVLIGYSRDDGRLLATGRVFVTGAYRDAEVAALIGESQADFAFLPSVWPETWCFALSEAWRAGLGVAAFDIGAQAERIRATGRGWLLPLGLSPAALNNALLNLRPLASA